MRLACLDARHQAVAPETWMKCMHANAGPPGTLHIGDAHYNLLLETMSEGLIETDEVASFVYVNPRFAALLGYAQEELIDRPARRFMADDAARSLAEHLVKRKTGVAE